MNHIEDNYIKTPTMKIKLGEVMLSEAGIPLLKVKKPGSNSYEKVPILTLQKMVIRKIEELRK